MKKFRSYTQAEKIKGVSLVAATLSLLTLQGCAALYPGLYDDKLLEAQQEVCPKAQGTAGAVPCTDGLVLASQKIQTTWNANYLKSARAADKYSGVLSVLAVAATGSAIFKVGKDALPSIVLTAGGLTVTRDFWATPGLDLTYLQGHRALTCFISNALPFTAVHASERTELANAISKLQEAITAAELASDAVTNEPDKSLLFSSLEAGRILRDNGIDQVKTFDQAYERLLRSLRAINYGLNMRVRSTRSVDFAEMRGRLTQESQTPNPPSTAIVVARASGEAQVVSRSASFSKNAVSANLAAAALHVVQLDRGWKDSLAAAQSCLAELGP